MTLCVAALAIAWVWDSANRNDSPQPDPFDAPSMPVRDQVRPVDTKASPGPTEPDADFKWSASRLRQLAEGGASVSDQRDALQAGLRERGVSQAQIDTVLNHTKETLILWKQDEPSKSWIGGPGLLPAGTTEWPDDAAGAPFTPVAHFDLDALPKLPSPFPRTGVLEVYYAFEWFNSPDPSAFIDAGRAYLLDNDAVELDEPDGDIYREEPTYLASALMPVAGEPERVVEEAGGPRKAKDLIDAMNELTTGLYGHQLGGQAREFQGDVLREIPYDLQEASPEFRDRYSKREQESPDAWRLLATIEAEGQMMFGDGGNLYMVIPKADLRSGRFDRALGIAQGA